MPARGNLFENVEDVPMREKFWREAKEVQHLGGGHFPSANEFPNANNDGADDSALSMTPAKEEKEHIENLEDSAFLWYHANSRYL